MKKTRYRDRVELPDGTGFDLIWRRAEKQGVPIFKAKCAPLGVAMTARLVVKPIEAPEGSFHPLEVVPNDAGVPFAKGLLVRQGGFKAVRADAARFIVACAQTLLHELHKRDEAN